jgi:hypothetical protein
MKYNLTLNQKSIVESGLDIDITDSYILYCLYHNYGFNYFLYNSEFIINELPLLRIQAKDTINRRIERLVKIGLIEREKKDDLILSIIKSKEPFRISVPGTGRCEWCFSDTISIQEHHYPIQKSKGGDQIVKICPSCHCDYHYLKMVGVLKLTEKIKLII